MYVRWLRDRDYRKRTSYPGKGEYQHRVAFTPYAESAIITNIRIHSNLTYSESVFDLKSYVTLHFSPRFKQELIDICRQLEIETRSDGIDRLFYLVGNFTSEIKICAKYANATPLVTARLDWNEENLIKILKLFAIFNDKVERNKPFPDELIADLIQIYRVHCQKSFKEFHHCVADGVHNCYRENLPKLKDYAEIFAEKQLSVDHRRYLYKGESPNTPVGGFNGWSPMHYAIAFQESIRALELLLWYGGNPFARRGLNFLTPYELAIALGEF